MLSSLGTRSHRFFMGLSGFSNFYDKALSKLVEEYLFSQPLSTTRQYEVLVGASSRSKVRLLIYNVYLQNMNYPFDHRWQIHTRKEQCRMKFKQMIQTWINAMQLWKGHRLWLMYLNFTVWNYFFALYETFPSFSIIHVFPTAAEFKPKRIY